MIGDRVGDRYSTQALSLLRIVAALLFLLHEALFNVDPGKEEQKDNRADVKL